MILTGSEIEKGIADGDIVIDPFQHANLGPNSYDFTLGSRCKIYKSLTLDARVENETEEFEIGSDGLLVAPSRLYLVNVHERMGSRRYVPIIRGRSSTGRLGLFVNITADLIDIGSINQWTLQLHSVLPIRIYPGMAIGQVTFWAVKGEIIPYAGKYGRLPSPVGSLFHLDFLNFGASHADRAKR